MSAAKRQQSTVADCAPISPTPEVVQLQGTAIHAPLQKEKMSPVRRSQNPELMIINTLPQALTTTMTMTVGPSDIGEHPPTYRITIATGTLTSSGQQ